MSIKEHLDVILEPYTDSLKETSFDSTNRKYLCNNKKLKPVFNFDKYVLDNNPSPLPASPDAIYLGENKFYFIEFKNSPLENIDMDNIKNKFNSGTTILKRILQNYLPQDNYEFIFCVVYQPLYIKYFNPMHIESNITRFGLDEENKNNGDFYNKIITNDVDFYKNNFKILRCS